MTTATYFGTTESISVTSTTADGAATHTVNVQFYHADTATWSYISRLHSVAGGTIDATISAKQYYNPSRS